MPLSIDSYANWAQTQGYRSGELASLRDAGGGPEVSSLRQTTGTLARFFNTRSVKDAKSAVLADFTRALTESYGETIANRAMNGVDSFLKLDRGLSAHVIQRAISSAENMRIRSGLRVDGGISLRVLNGTAEISGAVFGGLPHVDALVLRRSVRAQYAASNLLGQCPIGDAEVAAFDQKAAKVLLNLDRQIEVARTLDRNRLTGAVVDGLVASLEDIKTRLQAKRASVAALNADNPLSGANKAHALHVWHEGAQFALLRALAKYQDRPELAEALRQCKNLSFDELMHGLEISKDTGDVVADRLVEELTRRLPARVTVNADVMKAMVSKGFREALNAGDWTPIHKQFEGSLNGRAFALTSDIVPGRHQGEQIGSLYEVGVNGYMCHTADTRHAVNLAHSSITVDPGDGSGAQVAFSGIRHGVHSAWEIGNDATRRAANLQRAKEAVIAAYLSNPAAAKLGDDGFYHLPMASVSLLTPDWTRNYTFIGKTSNNERAMLQDQLDAWQGIGQRTVDVTAPDGRRIQVKPEVLAFNFGVNVGAVKLTDWVKPAGFLMEKVASGWGFSDPVNQVAFAQLQGRVAAFADQVGVDPHKADMAKKLCGQLEQILRSEDHHHDQHDAYKAAARVAVITHLIGGVPCWNCKSGKDRTGEMDAECKFLSTLIALKAPIPDPGQQLNDDQKALFRSIVLQSGNLEMQRYNTGLAGFKTGSVKSIGERLGGGEAAKYHKGGSSSVGV